MLIAILGRQPQIGYAELQSLASSDNVDLLTDTIAKVKMDTLEYQRFGSVIKFAMPVSEFAAASPQILQKQILKLITTTNPPKEGAKLKIGISVYGSFIRVPQINSMGLSIKKALKNKGYSARIIPNKGSALSSAQVIHNRLTAENGFEILIIKTKDKYILAKTVYEQDIEAYAARDQARPKRDARVGMLPPKLAQTIINLASGPINNSKSSVQSPAFKIVLDPFCGTGVILQEALLMGYEVYGTDLESRMIDYSLSNLDWLALKKPYIKGKYKLQAGDATNYTWEPKPTCVAAETYLGRPLSSLPKPDDLNKIIQDVNTLHKRFLENLHKQLAPGSRLCLAVPAWQVAPGRFKSLPILDQITKIGYNQLEFNNIMPKSLIYARENQLVGRQLVTLVKA